MGYKLSSSLGSLVGSFIGPYSRSNNKILENISFSDYTDRITFQKQIWQLNEMSSIINREIELQTAVSKLQKFIEDDINIRNGKINFGVQFLF